MMRKPISTGRRQHGAALVETVVVTPLLLFLILVTAEITNAFVEHNTLSKAVRNGARYLASNAIVGTTGVVNLTAPVIDATRNLVVFGSVTGGGTAVLSGLATANVQVTDLGNDVVQVTASYAYTGLLGGTLPSFGIGPDIGTAFNLQASVSMRAL
jgi:Flp pilus assembly protein TadG